MPEFSTTPEVEPPLRFKVFIDNPANQSTKNLYNEKTLEYIRSVEVSASYPYPYGFFLNTTSGDGDNLDCFILTDEKLMQAQTVVVEPIGLMEVIEDGKVDHKIIARLEGTSQEITDEVKDKLVSFIGAVFAHIPGKKMVIGNFLEKDEAIAMIQAADDSEDLVTPESTRYDHV